MLMNKALDNIFASDIDRRMMSHLPDYWQEYFNSKSQHRQFMPADANIKVVSEGMTPPKVLNSIDPSSNEYAQKYGIAGMELLRTVVDAIGNSAADRDRPPHRLRARRKSSGGDQELALPAGDAERSGRTGGDRLVVTFRIYSNRTKPGSVTKGIEGRRFWPLLWPTRTRHRAMLV